MTKERGHETKVPVADDEMNEDNAEFKSFD